MENFTFYSPTYFVFVKNAEEQTGACVKKIAVRRSFYIMAEVR